MKKADKLKQDLKAYSTMSEDVLDLEMVFVEKDGVLHARHKGTNNACGGYCRFAGNTNFTVTGLLNVFDNLDKVCPRCVDHLSFNALPESNLINLVSFFSSLVRLDKHFAAAEKFLKEDKEKFPEQVHMIEISLSSYFSYGVLKLIPGFPEVSPSKSYAVVFNKVYEFQLKRLNSLKEAFKDFMTSDAMEKEFLNQMVELILPTPAVCKNNNVAKVLVPELKKLREELVNDSSWCLFVLNLYDLDSYLNDPFVVLLQKYETKHENLFHAPQIYLDSIFVYFSQFTPSLVSDSARFKERLSDEMLENVVGIYDADGTGHNSKLSKVVSTAKII